MYKKVVLDNGLRIIMQPMPYFRSLALGYWIDAGVADEDAAVNGISHLMEHMIFKGTARRNARIIAETVEGVGGQLDAYTDKDHTMVHLRVLDEHLDLGVDLLSDMIWGSLIEPEELEREKGVLAEEIRMCEDLPESRIHDNLAACVLSGSPLAMPVLGSMPVLERLNRDDLMRYHASYYRPDNIIVAAAGRFDEDALVAALSRAVPGPAGPDRSPRQDVLPAAARSIGLDIRPTEQVHLALGCRAMSITSPERYVLSVLDRILGGCMSSRLFQEIREKRGLAYAVYTYQHLFRPGGLFGIYAGMSSENALEVTDLILRELERLCRRGVSASEVEIAGAQIKGSLYMGAESVVSVMRRLGKGEMYFNTYLEVEDMVRAVEAVTPEQVQALAGRIFQPDGLSLALIGALDDAQAGRIKELWEGMIK